MDNDERKHYVILDENNVILGFFDSKINSSIPDDAIEVTEEFKKYVINSHKMLKIIDVSKEFSTDNLEEIDIPPAPPNEFEKLRADVDFLMIMEGYADV